MHRLARLIVLLGAVLIGCSKPPQPDPPALVHPERAFTFAVVGDNKGGYDGYIAPVFRRIVESIRQDDPDLVINTGDMICGGSEVDMLRKQWLSYKDAIAPLKMPVHHVPGNHDIENMDLWREYWGKTSYSVDHAGCRFIILDTETEWARLGEAQYTWLAQQLDEAANRPVFIFLHRPLFPSGFYNGSCLDAWPEERDRLHRLFVQHRGTVQAVFAGHEHVYNAARHDGIRYYITGGGGAWPYATPENGGFHHYLLVHVGTERVTVELRRIAAP